MEIRDLVVLSHQGAGKTSLVESMLFTSGIIQRLGKVEDGTTVSDYDPIEIERSMGISLSLLSFERKGGKLNVLDAPGYADFVSEVKSSLRVCDGAVILVCAASGVEVGTEQMWDEVEGINMPCLISINKMDRDNADFYSTLEDIQKKLGGKCLPAQLPVGAQNDFRGVVDLLTMKSYFGPSGEEGKIPEELEEKARSFREKLLEVAIEVDDGLISKYLEGETISDEEFFDAVKRATREGKLVPVFAGSALSGIGTQLLLDAICHYLPSSEERGAFMALDSVDNEETIEPCIDAPVTSLIFKATADPYVGKLSYLRIYSGVISSNSQVWNANKGGMEHIGQLFTMMGKNQQPVAQLEAGDMGAVARLSLSTVGDTLCAPDHPLRLEGVDFPGASFSMAISPRTKADLDKMGNALARICEEDPSLQVSRNSDTNESIISGVGDAHLEIVREKMHRKFGVDVNLDLPRVPYKETITVPATAEYKHKKQSGGHGQYGHVILKMEPLPRGEGFEFSEHIFGGAIPRNYIPAVEKGVNEAKQEGILANSPVIDVKVVLSDGSFHPVDSSDIAFKIAAAQALKKGLSQGQSVLLEPITNITVTVPESYTGDVISDLNAKRGRVSGMAPAEGAGGLMVIRAQVPSAELLRYAIDLKSITQGRGSFATEFDHYEEVPPHISQKIISKAQKEQKTP